MGRVGARRSRTEAEVAQRRHVWLDGTGTQVAATGVRQAEARVVVQQRAEEHDDGPGPPGRLDVDAVQVQYRGRDDLQVVAPG